MNSEVKAFEEALKGLVAEDPSAGVTDMVDKGKAQCEKFLMMKHLAEILEEGVKGVKENCCKFVGDFGELTTSGDRYINIGHYRLTRYKKENKSIRPGAEDVLKMEDPTLLRKAQTIFIDEKKVLALHKDGQISAEVLKAILKIDPTWYLRESNTAE